jgi:eukaryotic-like serine/threonine-protein kinase
MSEVWKAHDLELDRHVALKILGLAADRTRFRREAQAVAGLTHPHICQLYDYGDLDGRPFMVLELLTGGTLEGRLAATRPLPDIETERIAREVASAIGHAHEQGVLHRDVKPTNVLFDEEGRAKLADFGIARVAGEPTLTEAGTLLGTASYISPEQSRGKPVTPATDVYAFGVLLYQMLTGRLPFEAENLLETAEMHATREVPPILSLRPDAPPNLERVATRALSKRPGDRPADGNALVADLGEPAAETLAIEADETRIIAPRRSRVPPRHLAAGIALVALAIVGAAAAVLLTAESSKAPVVTGMNRTATSGPSTQATTPSTPPTTEQTTGQQTTGRQTTAPATTAPSTASQTTMSIPSIPTTPPTITLPEPTTTEVTTVPPLPPATTTETPTTQETTTGR